MLNLKAKLTRAKPSAVASTGSLTTATTAANSGASSSPVAASKTRTKTRPDAATLTLSFLKETPPDLVLELLVPYLLDQLLKRASYLRQRRTEIEERQQELHRRQQDVSGLTSGQAGETSSHPLTEVEVVRVAADPTQSEGDA